jgi:hypothetical protein
MSGGQLKKSIFSRSITALFILFCLFCGSSRAENPKDFQSEIVRNLCNKWLTDSVDLAFAPIKGAPGLLSLRSSLPDGVVTIADLRNFVRERPSEARFEEHELESSVEYAAAINKKYGEHLVFLPTMDQVSIPGFDGIILNSTGKPIANFTLKKITIGKSARRIHKVVVKGDTGADHFAYFKDWVRVAVSISKTAWTFADSEELRQAALFRASSFLLKAVKIFGISTSRGVITRPHRIVVDAQAAAPEILGQINRKTIYNRIKAPKSNIESVHILQNNQKIMVFR